jgi:aldose 1-epimerase
MPVAIGYHPWFQLTDSPREEWTVVVPARTRWLLSYQKVPTGETEPADTFFPGFKGALKDYNLDDVFSDLARDGRGRATAVVKGRRQQIPPPAPPAAAPSAPAAAAPPNPLATPNFICFEPMAGITDALNLAHKGLYKELQSIPPGGTWRESFWVRPSGF